MKSDRWRFHHIIERSKGGTDKPDNRALLHKTCHSKLHRNNLQSKLKKNKQYKESTFMNIIKNRFQRDLNCEITFGYETYCKRNELGLEKSHSNDAFVISGGKIQSRSIEYYIKQKRRNNRCLQVNRKGFKSSIRRKRHKLQPYDLVKIDNKIYTVRATHCLGTRVQLRDRKKDIAIKNIDWSFHSKSLIWRNGNDSSPA